MLIVSKFHDYYDTAIGFGGVDKTTVYQREQVVLNPHDLTPDYNYFETAKTGCTWELCVVGFCGKLYPVVKTEEHHLHRYPMDPTQVKQCFYTEKEVLEWLSREDVRRRKRRFYRWWRRGPEIDKGAMRLDKFVELDKLFLEHKCPIFVKDQVGIITLNPPLKDSQFFKVFSPFEAYQEIYMYLSGVLGNTNQVATKISDEVMAAKKGFNKWSFRRPGKNSI